MDPVIGRTVIAMHFEKRRVGGGAYVRSGRSIARASVTKTSLLSGVGGAE